MDLLRPVLATRHDPSDGKQLESRVEINCHVARCHELSCSACSLAIVRIVFRILIYMDHESRESYISIHQIHLSNSLLERRIIYSTDRGIEVC